MCVCVCVCVCVCDQMSSLDVLIKEIDRWTGMAKCRDIISRLEYLHDDQVCIQMCGWE